MLNFDTEPSIPSLMPWRPAGTSDAREKSREVEPEKHMKSHQKGCNSLKPTIVV